MKETYKAIYDTINPEPNLLDSVLEQPQRRNKPVIYPILAAAMCLCLCVTGIYSANHSTNSSAEKIISSETAAGASAQNTNGSIIIAYAGAGDVKLQQTCKNFVQYPMLCKIGCVDIQNLNEQEIESKTKEIKEEYRYIQQTLNNEKVNISTLTQTERLEHVLVYTCTSGMFNLDIKNPEEVKKIQVKTSSKYGKADICTHDQKKLQDNFIIGTDISIDGARYAKNIADAKADNTSGYFQIHWKAADAVYDELDKNPDMDLSKIHDTISFIVEFRNGDTATSIVDISFDAEGYMYAKCKSYNYVVKS